MTRTLKLFIIGIFLVGSLGAEPDGASTVETLRFKYDVAQEELDARMATNVLRVNKQYLAALAKVRIDAKASADLDGLVQVIDEIKAVGAAGEKIYKPENQTSAAISKLRPAYVKGVSKFDQERNGKLASLIENYLKVVDKTKRDLIAKEDVENARKLETEEERVRDLLTSIRPAVEPVAPAVPSGRSEGEPGWISKDATYTISSEANTGATPSLLTREKDTIPSGDGFSFHSDTQMNPYIVIDLGKQKIIGGMNIINRTGADKDRAATLAAWVSPTRCFEGIKPVWEAEGTETQWIFELPKAVKGRYIKLGLRVSDIFHLRYVKILGWETEDQSHPPIPEVTSKEEANMEDGLLVHFPFDRSPDQKLVSEAIGDISMVVTGAKWTSDGRRTGAMSFDGEGDQLEVSPFKWGAPFTCSAWVQFRSFNDGSGVMQIGNGWLDNCVMIGNRKTGPGLGVSVSDRRKNEETLSGSDFWEKDKWVHITLTMDRKDVISVYKNGQIRRRKSSDVSFKRDSRTKQFFGTSGQPGGFFDGLLDDIRIYDRAHSESEVATLFRLDGGYQ